MTKLIEFLHLKGGTVLVNPQNIALVRPVFDEDDVWKHTAIGFVGGTYINVNASLEQIEDALKEETEE